MAPPLTQSEMSGSVMRAMVVEIASFAIIFMFLVLSLHTSNEALSLIASPKFIIMLFVMFNTPLQIFLHLIVNPMLNPEENIDEYSMQKSRFRLQKIVRTTCGSLVAFVSVWCLVHLIAVLFGAHFVQGFGETAIWAALVSSMIVTPGVCILGPKARKWLALFNFRNFESTSRRRFYYCVICTGIGSWLSPIVIPLDWDRPWQIWPVPGVIGTLLGYCFGLFMSGFRTWRDTKCSKIH